jgi:nucleotide-binding universal stress UspA family protein
MITIKRILVPIDFSHSARYALDIAVDLAEKFEAKIHLLHVFEMPFDYPHLLDIEMDESDLYGAIQAEMEAALENLVRQFSGTGVPIEAHFIENGVPFVEIIHSAKKLAIDLIVMSAYSRMGISNLLIGGVTEKVVRKAPCPVLTIRNKGMRFEMP